MATSEARKAQYVLSIEAFVDGLAEREPKPFEFGLTEAQAEQAVREWTEEFAESFELGLTPGEHAWFRKAA